MGRPKSVFRTVEEVRAATRERNRRWKNSFTPERRAEYNIRQRGHVQRSQQRRKARERGLTGPPLQRTRGYARNAEEQAGAETVHQPAPADAMMEEAMQHANNIPHAPPGTHVPPATLRLRTPDSSLGFWSVPLSPIPQATNHRSAPGPLSSSTLDLLPSLSAPGSSTSGQRQAIQAPRQAMPSLARMAEDESLRLTLAPPGEHDRLCLTLAPPRHD